MFGSREVPPGTGDAGRAALPGQGLARDDAAFSRVAMGQCCQAQVTHVAMLDREGNVVSANSAWCAFAREHPGAVLTAPLPGVNYLDACQEAAAQGDETAREALCGIGTVLAGSQRLFTMEYEYAGADPLAPQWFVVEVTPLEGPAGGITITHQEVTERRQFEQAVADFALRYWTVSAQASDYAYEIRVEADGTLVFDWVTEAFTRVTGYAMDELVGRPAWRRFIHPADHALARRHLSRLLKGDNDTAEFRIVTRDGAVRWLRNQARAVWDGGAGRVVAIDGAAQDITDQKRTEEDLDHHRLRLQALFDHALDAILLADDAGRFVDANPAACALLGYRAEEIRRLQVWDVTAEPEAMQAAWQDLVAAGQQRGDYTLRSRDGRLLDAEYRAVANILPGLHLYVWRDVTEQKRAEKALRESEERWRMLVDHHPEAILVTVEGRVAFVNRAGAELAGRVTAEPVVGRSLADFVSAEEVELVDRWRRAVERGESLPPAEYTLIRLDGEERQVEATSASVVYDGRPAVQTVLRDVTERKHYEQGLIAARDEAERAARLRTTILSNMSHEIRTPLTTVLGFSEILVEELSGDQRELAQLIERGGRRLSDTLNSVLDLARLEAGALLLHPETLDAVAKVKELVEAARPLLSGEVVKDVQLQVVTPEAPVRAHLDVGVLSRVLGHLLSNAIKFTDQGTVCVRLEASDDRVRLQVQDTGIGIAPEFMPHLFEEFEQESTGLARSYEGSGLGLTITRRLIELVGGTIEVDSEKGKGSTFTVLLPRYMTLVARSAA